MPFSYETLSYEDWKQMKEEEAKTYGRVEHQGTREILSETTNPSTCTETNLNDLKVV